MARDLAELSASVAATARDLDGPLLDAIVTDAGERVAAMALDTLRQVHRSTTFAGDTLTATARGSGKSSTVDLSPAGTWVLLAGARPHPQRARRGVFKMASPSGARGTLYRAGPVRHPGFTGTDVVGRVADGIDQELTDAAREGLEGLTDGW